MSTTLLVHPRSLALTTLPRVGNSSSTPLPFPTRYPKDAVPRTKLSSFSSHTYLWCDSLPIVWEYDSKGRRVGEIRLSSNGKEHVLGVGCLDGSVVVVTTHQAGIWRRIEGKWAKVMDLEVRLTVELS